MTMKNVTQLNGDLKKIKTEERATHLRSIEDARRYLGELSEGDDEEMALATRLTKAIVFLEDEKGERQ